MEQYVVKILSIHDVTHNVRAYRIEKLFSNKTAADIIYHAEFDEMLGRNVIYVLTAEDNPSYRNGPINKTFLQKETKDFSQPFYVCGPDPMVAELTKTLANLGANPETVVFEK